MEGANLSQAKQETAVLAAGNMAGVDLTGAQLHKAAIAGANVVGGSTCTRLAGRGSLA